MIGSSGMGKKFFKQLVLWELKRMTKRRVKKFKGKVIAVTGSIGKTSTKDAIFTVLNTRYKVKKSEKSMNTDMGLFLTILEIDNGNKSIGKWSWLLMKAFYNSFFTDHSDIMLLEFGVDKPGDMDFLTSIVKPDIAVLSNVFPVHLDEGQFKNVAEIFDEKKKIVEKMKKEGVAILGIDNEYVAAFAKRFKDRKRISFGQGEECEYRAEKIATSIEGTEFVLNHEGQKFQVRVPAVGEFQVYMALPAIACGNLLGISIEEAIYALERFRLPPGRMNLIDAIEGAKILDGSYNASPEAVKEALRTLKDIGMEKRKIAVIGNMNELGDETVKLHEMVGSVVPECADMLITVGANARYIGESAIKNGMEEGSVHHFKTAPEAAEWFKDKITDKDLVLVKGSQNNVRLERFVKALMARPEEAGELLARQEKIWQTKL